MSSVSWDEESRIDAIILDCVGSNSIIFQYQLFFSVSFEQGLDLCPEDWAGSLSGLSIDNQFVRGVTTDVDIILSSA